MFSKFSVFPQMGDLSLVIPSFPSSVETLAIGYGYVMKVSYFTIENWVIIPVILTLLTHNSITHF